jgi:MinD superfamily P-loop ATPase
VAQLIENIAGAIIVTTPQELAIVDVRRCITFCRTVNVPILGVVENMSGFVCPSCGAVSEIFGSGGGERMAQDMGVPFLTRIPLDAKIVAAGDAGVPLAAHGEGRETARAFERIVHRIQMEVEGSGETAPLDATRLKE